MDDIQVMICDDSALMRNLIQRIVDGTDGMSVCATAMNGKFALQKLETVKPDIIVLDIEMPEMNGVQFLEERKKRNIKMYNVEFYENQSGESELWNFLEELPQQAKVKV